MSKVMEQGGRWGLGRWGLGRWGLTPIKRRNQVLNGVKSSKEDFNLLNWKWGQTPSPPKKASPQKKEKTSLDISLRVNCKLRTSLAQE